MVWTPVLNELNASWMVPANHARSLSGFLPSLSEFGPGLVGLYFLVD
jgi:hypothetical protein